jgi:hypothetical protein
MTNKKNLNLIEDAEFGLDSRYKSKKERKANATALMEARLKRMKNLSGDQIIRAKLIQLKLRMEAFIEQPIYDNRNYFSEFLEAYIDTIYPKRSLFANGVDITPVRLSQVINDYCMVRIPQGMHYTECYL